MLDIGVIVPHLTSYGGAERFAVECLARWQRAHRLTVYSAAFNRAILQEHGVDLDRVRMVQLAPPHKGDHAWVLNGLLLPRKWAREIGPHQVYHGHQWQSRFLDLQPMVWYPHEPLRVLHDLYLEHPLNWLANNLKENLAFHAEVKCNGNPDLIHQPEFELLTLADQFGKPDRIVANSRQTARYLETVYGVPVSDVVYPGVDADTFPPVEASDNTFVMLSRVEWYKGLRLTLEALSLVPEARLDVLGGGNAVESYREMAKNLGIGERVQFLAGLSNAEIKDRLARCRAVIFMPIREPFGIVALEALAAGKPLIAAAEGGYAEVVNDSCAFLVPPLPGAIAERMGYLCDHPEVAERMGQAGRAIAAAHTWDRTAEELLSILEQVAGKTKTGQPPAGNTISHLGPRFGVFYRCGYGEGLGAGQWQMPGENLDMPLLGYYPSWQGQVIEYHLRELAAARIDLMVLDLHVEESGVDGHELVAAGRIFRVAEKVGSSMRFAVRLIGDVPNDSLHHLVKLVRKTFARQRSYLRVQGRPVLFLDWDCTKAQEKCWRDFARLLRSDFLLAASCREADPSIAPGKQFDGACLALPHSANEAAAWELSREQALRGMPAALRVLTVSPGTPRDRETAYRDMLDFARSVEVPPDLVVVASFNDFPNGTYIEGSQKHGCRLMTMTKQFIEEARSGWRCAGVSRAAA